MKKILLLGAGAREHVIGETLKRSAHSVELTVYAKHKNPGLEELATYYELGELNDWGALRKCAHRIQPDFAIIGPDNPIADGAADVLLELGIRSVAPLKALAQIESSKSFARDLMEKYQIPGNPRFRVFENLEGIRYFMETLGRFVVKADGLEGGKGVKLSGEHLHSIDEGLHYSGECIDKYGRVVIEEKLEGEEFSLLFFVDGQTAVPMPAVQDHKRAFEGDTGPNTGGMGTYSDSNHSLPFLDPEDIEEACHLAQQVVNALKQETGKPYQGILYGGFMAVKEGIRLIEFNARFGDPEAMNVLPLLETDFVEVCEALLGGKLSELPLQFAPKATVVKYVVPEGYPESPVKGALLNLNAIPSGARTYFASVEAAGEDFKTLGSRAIAFLGLADTLEEAEKIAEAGAVSVEGPVFHRSDIGTEVLIQKRIEHMKRLRGI